MSLLHYVADALCSCLAGGDSTRGRKGSGVCGRCMLHVCTCVYDSAQNNERAGASTLMGVLFLQGAILR